MVSVFRQLREGQRRKILQVKIPEYRRKRETKSEIPVGPCTNPPPGNRCDVCCDPSP